MSIAIGLKGSFLCSMAFLKVERKKSGSYLRILESYRNDEGKPTSRVLYSLGKVEDFKPEELRRIGIKLYQLGGGEFRGLLDGDLKELARFNYGYQKVYVPVLEHYGLKNLFDRLEKKHKLKHNLFNAILLMLIERLQDPCSKLRNYHHREEYLGLTDITLQHLYRSLDKLAQYNELIQGHIFQTGRNLFNQQLDVVFYDVTTFYFSSDVEIESAYRQMGFGKDGKIGKTQILFCMMIDAQKNPIGYRIFKGNTFEGDTYEHALNDLKKRYQIDKVVVVADRGMLSKKNIALTTQKGYEFIIGERLKSLPKPLQAHLINLENYSHEWRYEDATGQAVLIRYTIIKTDEKTIIGTYSSKRARKDKADREKKIEQADRLLKKPATIQAKAQRHYLKPQNSNSYILDEEKIRRAEKYDGFLAISTNNNTLSVSTILDQYKQLFKIEHSFRTFKSHLETRPMFHWTNQRIEGHICLCYIAFTIQNYVLQKLNDISETQLREALDKMQFSLIERDGEKSYLKSNPGDLEQKILSQLALKPSVSLQKAESFKI